MKKILLSLGLFAFTLCVSAQAPIFSEDFEGVTTTPVGGVSVGDVPSGWTLYDEDGNVPASGVSFMDKAWKVRANGDSHGNVAVSTSWYDPVGTSNDWMVSPQITIPNNTNFALLYDVSAFQAPYPDSYEVRISTTGNTPADFTDAALIAEASPASFSNRVLLLDSYAGEDIYIAFRNTAIDQNMLLIDNIKVKELPQNDVALTEIILPTYFKINSAEGINVKVKNLGGNVVNTATIEWSDGVNTNSHEYTGLNISPYQVKNIALQIYPNYSVPEKHDITVNITDVNGVADTYPSDNEGLTTVYTVSTTVTKKVVIEEGTGTWCGWCPRGIVAMKYMYDNPSMFPNFIGIAVHNGDPMTVNAYDGGANFSGFPGSNVDRVMLDQGVSSPAWKNYYNARKDIMVPAVLQLEANMNETSREITATVASDFYTKFSNANFRLALVVVEDKVSGTSSGWTQSNYFYDGQSGAMGGFENMPGSVSGLEFDRVGRALIGGYNGQSGSVPSTINDEDHFTYDFTYTLPDNIDAANSSIVALLIDQVTGEILNATEAPISTLGIGVNELSSNFKLFPNPATDQVNVTFSNAMNGKVVMNIYTLDGKIIETKEFNSITEGENIQINTSKLTTGEYLISFSTPEGAFVKNLIVK